jgi:hypothetical protein
MVLLRVRARAPLLEIKERASAARALVLPGLVAGAPVLPGLVARALVLPVSVAGAPVLSGLVAGAPVLPRLVAGAPVLPRLVAGAPVLPGLVVRAAAKVEARVAAGASYGQVRRERSLPPRRLVCPRRPADMAAAGASRPGVAAIWYPSPVAHFAPVVTIVIISNGRR